MTERPIFRTIEEACHAVAIEYPKRDPVPGRWTRADYWDGRRLKRDDASVLMFLDCRGGYVKNWVTSAEALWFDDYDGRKLTRAELAERNKRLKEARRVADAWERKLHVRAARFAAELIAASRPAVSVGHAYLARKGVRPVPLLGVMDADEIKARRNAFYRANLLPGEEFEPYSLGRYDDADRWQPWRGSVLIVPLFSGLRLSCISSLEFIAEDGQKQALKQGAAGGAFWIPNSLRLGNPSPEIICIAEGLATALSISQVTGRPCVAARSCGNLKATAEALSSRYSRSGLLICSDLGNGEKDAQEAARSVGAQVVKPEFSDELMDAFRRRTGSEKATDFNDYYLATGQL